MKNLRLFIAIVMLLGCNVSFGFETQFHVTMTNSALSSKFDSAAVGTIALQDSLVDLLEGSNPQAHFDNSNFSGGQSRITSLIDSIQTDLKSCNRPQALTDFGKALHTVQDFYSHSNFVDNFGSISPAVDFTTISSSPPAPIGGTCNYSTDWDPKGLTSGYYNYSSILLPCLGIPTGVCCHSGIFGLNKDSPLPEDSPGDYGNFAPAYTDAIAGSQNFVTTVEGVLTKGLSSADAATLLNYFEQNKQKQWLFCIDDTGSMGAGLIAVQAAVDSLATSAPAGTSFRLIAFNDPEITDFGDTCDAASFVSQVNSLSAGGGGDCPEVSNAAALQAVNEAAPGSTVAVYTDASSHDPELGALIYAEAIAKQVTINWVQMGDCAPGTFHAQASIGFKDSVAKKMRGITTQDLASDLTSSSAYAQSPAISTLTGGLYFGVTHEESQQATNIFASLAKTSTVPIVSYLNALTGTEMDIPVPVDSSINSLTFTVSLVSGSETLPSFNIVRPDGTTVQATDSGVTQTVLSTTNTYQITSPATGTWIMKLNGTGTISASVLADTNFQVNLAQFVGSNPGSYRPEVTYVPISGNPPVGTPATLMFNFSSMPQNVMLNILGQDGTVLSSATPTQATDSPYLVTFTPPSQFFVMSFSGTLPNGQAYQRIIPQRFEAQTVALALTPLTQSAFGGQTVKTQLTVNNLGSASTTYTVLARSAEGFAITQDAPTITVSAGGSATMNIEESIPTGLTSSVNDTLAVAATSTTDATVFNTATAALSVQPVAPPVASDLSFETVSGDPLTGGESVQFTLPATDPQGLPLTYSIVGQPLIGTLSGTAPQLTYTPNPRYDGTDTIMFKANNGIMDSNIGTVRITIKGKLHPFFDVRLDKDPFSYAAGDVVTAIVISDAYVNNPDFKLKVSAFYPDQNTTMTLTPIGGLYYFTTPSLPSGRVELLFTGSLNGVNQIQRTAYVFQTSTQSSTMPAGWPSQEDVPLACTK